MDYNIDNPYDLAKYIKNTKKTTPIKVYINGCLKNINMNTIEWYGNDNFYVLFGESEYILDFLELHKSNISNFRIEFDRRNSAIPLLDILNLNARIEPGAIIRDGVKIGDNSVIMMGAVINIGAEIGDYTMIDMNAVVGARGKIGTRVHIGAGAVIAGVLEPPNSVPCVIEDDVLVGANSVILEGITIGKSSVVAAGSVVTSNVPPNVVVAGVPAKIIKSVDAKTKHKTKLLDDLR